MIVALLLTTILFGIVILLKHCYNLNDRLTKEIQHSVALEKTIEEIIKK